MSIYIEPVCPQPGENYGVFLINRYGVPCCGFKPFRNGTATWACQDSPFPLGSNVGVAFVFGLWCWEVVIP
jgi:hypothetical protein